MRAVALVILGFGGPAALAHDVPVRPSGCPLDTFELTASGAGLSAAVSPPGAADALRIVYSVATATAQFQQRTVTPRAFTIGGVAGTIAFPQAFDARLSAGGDLHADAVGLAVTLGGVPATVPVALTTAVLATGTDVATGNPMAADGRFALVGLIPAGTLPPPLDASATLLRFGCRASPAPDLDQFDPAITVGSLAGVLAASTGKLRAVLRGGSLVADAFTGGPAMLHLAAGGAAVVTTQFPDGFVAQEPGLLVAEAAGGSRLTLRLGRGKRRARLLVDLPGAVVPAGASGPIDVQATLSAGTVLARGGRPFRARGGTLRAGS